MWFDGIWPSITSSYLPKSNDLTNISHLLLSLLTLIYHGLLFQLPQLLLLHRSRPTLSFSHQYLWLRLLRNPSLMQLLMFLLFERQKHFFEFTIPDQEGTKWALLATAGVNRTLSRYGCCYFSCALGSCRS